MQAPRRTAQRGEMAQVARGGDERFQPGNNTLAHGGYSPIVIGFKRAFQSPYPRVLEQVTAYAYERLFKNVAILRGVAARDEFCAIAALHLGHNGLRQLVGAPAGRE